MLQNLRLRFDWHYIGQIYGGDFAKFWGLLRIYELYLKRVNYLNILKLCDFKKVRVSIGNKFRKYDRWFIDSDVALSSWLLTMSKKEQFTEGPQ